MTNLYGVLGVAPSASDDELKRTYRRLSRERHPDLGGNEQDFKMLGAAYAILSDPDKRQRYDRERRAYLAQLSAVECPKCGEGNRIPRLKKGVAAHCGRCRAELPALPRSPIADRAVDAVMDIGERIADHGAALASDGIDLAFAKLRSKLGLGGRRERSR